jgi:perosamine synthetase
MSAKKKIPYGKQVIEADDIEAVTRALKSDWLTTGPEVEAFESAFAEAVGARHAVSFSNGTAALHGAVFAVGIGSGDEVVVPTMTFAASANSVVYQGGTPRFADIDAETLLIDPESARAMITKHTKALVTVDYAGQPCDYKALRSIADTHRIPLIADACHSLGATFEGTRVGSLADLTAFSFHPVKHMTTGEGGMVTTNDSEFAARMRRFRNHGIDRTHRDREKLGTWQYEMSDLGFNYRLCDIQCALGQSQLKKLPRFLDARRKVAAYYDRFFANYPELKPLKRESDRDHAYHLYVVQIQGDRPAETRERIFRRLQEAGINVNVHYLPVHLHAYYRNAHGTTRGLCPRAEEAYERILSLPIFPGLTEDDLSRIVSELEAAIRK